MIINKGSKKSKIDGEEKIAIIEYVFENYTIFVFEGKLSQFDILVRYKKGTLRIRTPKHIHWVVDILMKMQGKEKLTKEFLEKIKMCWNNCKPLTDRNFEILKNLIEDGEKEMDINKFTALNAFGEYDVEFLYVLMQLLSVQEKTNRADAYMFGKIIDELLEAERDIFKISGYLERSLSKSFSISVEPISEFNMLSSTLIDSTLP